MKVFLSYASEDRGAADDIRHALNADGHDVFFDREDLPPGEEFHARIRRAIERADLLIFLVSPRAVDAGSYTLNELAIAERAWKGAAGRLLPVVLERVSVQALPPFLRSVTFLEPEGNVTAAVADAVHRRARERRGKVKWAAAAAIAASAVLAAFLYIDCGTPAVRDSADGAPAVLVPAGTFIFGDDEAAVRREVYVDAFYMDRYEITTARYAKFL